MPCVAKDARKGPADPLQERRAAGRLRAQGRPTRWLSGNPIMAPKLRIPTRLDKKPLVEAIFELRWALHGDEARQRDAGFRLLLGRYYDKVRHAYPALRDLPASQLPEELAAYVVRHQFRASENGWPVIQLGPGLLTVNDTAGYTWDGFRPRVLEASGALFDSYPVEVASLDPVQVQLRYQNALEYDPEDAVLTDFLRDRLHTGIQVDPELYSRSGGASNPHSIHLNLLMRLTDPPGEVSLLVASGEKDSTPAIVLELLVRSLGLQTPESLQQLGGWLDRAHKVIEEWFFTLCRGDLVERFKPSYED